MSPFSSGYRRLRRALAVVAILALAASPAPLAAASSGHCAGDHMVEQDHAGGGAPTGAVAGGMGSDMPAGCPHCAAPECAALAACAGGVTAVGAAAMPALGAAIAGRATAAPAPAGPRSLVLAPPTPPPLPIP